MKSRKKRRWPFLLLIMALLLAIVLWRDNGRRYIQNTDYTVSSPELPQAFDGFRIVQLSDLHGWEFGTDSTLLAAKVREQKPDIIVLTGDMIDESTDMAVLTGLLPQLSAIAPTWFVSGNHEWPSGKTGELNALLDNAGIPWLHNEYLTLERNGASILLCGVEDPNSWSVMTQPDELVTRLRDSHPDAYVILLGHRNYWAETYPELDVDLILCGHGHGGIVRLPLIGGLLDTGHSLFPEYDAGLYDSGPYQMIVSRGLGNSIVVPRLFNPPELVTVTLCSE